MRPSIASWLLRMNSTYRFVTFYHKKKSHTSNLKLIIIKKRKVHELYSLITLLFLKLQSTLLFCNLKKKNLKNKNSLPNIIFCFYYFEIFFLKMGAIQIYIYIYI